MYPDRGPSHVVLEVLQPVAEQHRDAVLARRPRGFLPLLVDAVEVHGELQGQAGDLVILEDAEEAVQPGGPQTVVLGTLLRHPK